MKKRDYEPVDPKGGVYQVIEDVKETIEDECGGGVEIRRTHPSFGKARLSRRSGDASLFGSDLRHHGSINLEIMRAEECWHLGQHWNHEKGTLIEISLSYSQFVRLMGNMNVGEGADCTIGFVAHVPKEQCGSIKAPRVKPNVQELTEAEITKSTERVCREVEEAMGEIQAVMGSKKSFGKGDMQKALDALERIHRKFKGDEWKVQTCYKEQMEKLTNEAKTEADAYIQNAVIELGERSLAKAIAAGDITREQVQAVLGQAQVQMLAKTTEVDPRQEAAKWAGRVCPNCGTRHLGTETICILCDSEMVEGLEKPEATGEGKPRWRGVPCDQCRRDLGNWPEEEISETSLYGVLCPDCMDEVGRREMGEDTE